MYLHGSYLVSLDFALISRNQTWITQLLVKLVVLIVILKIYQTTTITNSNL